MRIGHAPCMAKAPAVKWTREHFLIALNLYCKLPFGQLHKGNPIIKEVAAKMGRTPSSLSMKLCNFASLDPVQQARGIKGLAGATKQDREMWVGFTTGSPCLVQRANNCSTTCSRTTKRKKWISSSATECGSSRPVARPKFMRRSKFVAANSSSGNLC